MAKKHRRRTFRANHSNRRSRPPRGAAPRRSLRIETLEPRLLLAADLVTESQGQALQAGVGALTDLFDRVDNTDALSAALPLLTQATAGEPSAVNIGEQLDIGGILFSAIEAPVTTYFESTFDPTSAGISAAINAALTALDADASNGLTIVGDVTDTSTESELSFEVLFTAAKTVDVQIDFESAIAGSPLTVNEVHQTTLDLSYRFDADFGVRPDSESGSDAFFIDFDNAADEFTGNEITASVGVAEDMDNPEGAELLPAFAGTVGFLGVETQAGAIEMGSVVGSMLDLDVNVPLTFSAQPAGAPALLASPLADLVTLETDGAGNRFNMDLPLIVEFNGLDLGSNPADEDKARVVINDPDLFDGEFDLDEPFFVFENGDQLTDFRTVTAVGMFTVIQSLQGVFSEMQNSDVFQKEIPFTNGKTLADVLDLGGAFGARFTDNLDGDDPQDSGPAFNDVQQFVNLLASRISYAEDDDGDELTHDPVITFDLAFQHQFDVAQFGLDFGFDLGDLANLTTDSEVSVEADLDAQLQLGVILARAEGGLPLTRETPLAHLNDGAGIVFPPEAELSFTLRNGRDFVVDVGAEAGSLQTLGDLIDLIQDAADSVATDTFGYDLLTQEAKDAIAIDPVFSKLPTEDLRRDAIDNFGSAAGMFRVLISDNQDALEIVDSTHISIFGGMLTPGAFGLDDSDPTVADGLGLIEGRTDENGAMGRPINGRFELVNDTLLSELNRGMGVDTVSPAVSSGDSLDDLNITLQDGTTFAVDLSARETIGDVFMAINAAAGGAALEVTFNEDYTGLRLVDGTTGTSALKVEGVNGSLAAVSLGIAGEGEIDEEDGSSRIEGSPLHGLTLADSVFIRQVAAASGSAADLTAPTTIELGTAVAALGTGAVVTGTGLSIQLPTGSDLSGVFAGDRLTLDGIVGALEIVGVNDREDRLDIAAAPGAGATGAWSVESNVNLSRVAIGDVIQLAGWTGGIDGGDQFEVVAVDDQNDTVEVATTPTSNGEIGVWSIERLSPMVSGTVRVIGADIDADATFGFVEVTVVDGTATGQLTADLSLGDTGTAGFDNRVTLNEAYDGLRDVALKVTGRNEVTFPDNFADSYGGVLKFTIEEPNEEGNQTEFAIPFFVPGIPPRQDDAADADTSNDPAAGAANQMAATEAAAEEDADKTNPLMLLLTKELELSLQAVAAAAVLRSELDPGLDIDPNDLLAAVQDTPDPRIKVGNSGNKLTFSLADGVARRLTVSAGEPTDLTETLNLTSNDVQLILNLLSNVPGLGVDRELNIDDLVDSEAAVFDLGVTADPAKVTFDNEPVLDEDYSGNLLLQIDDGAMPPTEFTVAFTVDGDPDAVTLSDLVDDLNEALETATDTATSMTTDLTNRIEVGQASGHLIFRLAEAEMRHPLVVSAVAGSEAAVENLGLTGEEATDDPSAYVARPKLTGAGQSDLPINVDLNIPGFTTPGLPEISIGIPDLSLDDFSLPGALNIDFGQLGDLFEIRDLSLTSVILALQTGLAYLEGLEFFEELEFLNVDLPMLDLNLKDMLNIADAFGDIAILLEANPVAGLGQVEEFIEDALGIPEDVDGTDPDRPEFPVFVVPELNAGLEFNNISLSNAGAFPETGVEVGSETFLDLDSYLQFLQSDKVGTIEVSLDRDGAELAVRIDLGLELTQQRTVPINLDLSNLPPIDPNLDLSNLVDFNAESTVDVTAGAFVGLSVGIDLTHEDGVKPFLYDVEQISPTEFGGTRVELKPRFENIDPINFSAAVGPLGIEITNGSLSLTGDDPADPAKLVVGLKDTDENSRHYFDEIVARGETVKVVSGRRAVVTQGDPTIELPNNTDLSAVRAGDTLTVGGVSYEIVSTSEGADATSTTPETPDTVVVLGLPPISIGSAKWEITRGLDVKDGSGASVEQNVLKVQLPSETDLMHVEVGNTITLSGQTGGINGSDTFEITAVNDDDDTVFVATQPSTTDSLVEWEIHRNGDFEFLLGIGDLDLSASGQANASLPISFPGVPLGGFTDTITAAIDLTGLSAAGNLLDAFSSITVSSDGGLSNAFSAFLNPANFDLLGMVGGWDGVFDRLIEAMRGQVLGVNIPLIGDALKDEADFLDQIKESVSGNLHDNASQGQNDSGGVRSALYDALGPGGLGWLQDIDTIGNTGTPVPDGFVTIDDVVVRADDTHGVGTGFVFDVHLGQELQAFELPVGFDLGIPGLNLDLNAPVTAKLGFDVRLSAGLNVYDGFYIVTGANNAAPEIQMFVDVSIPGLAASGELAFLRIDAQDIPSAIATVGAGGNIDSQLRVIAKRAGDDLAGVAISFIGDAAAGAETAVYDAVAKTLVFHIDPATTTAGRLHELISTDQGAPGNPDPVFANFRAEFPFGSRGDGLIDVNATATTVAELPSHFRGEFNVDLVDPDNDDGLLTIGEMLRSDISDVIEFDLNGVADVNLALMAELGGETLFPSIRTDFGLDWQIDVGSGFVQPTIDFNNVEMNLGEFFGDFAGPVLGQIQDVLGPVQPVIDVLTGRLPVLSDLLGQKVSFVDLAKLYGGTAQVAGFLEGVAQVVTVINALPDIDAGEWLDFGGFTFDVETDTIIDVRGAAADIYQKLQEVGSSFDPAALLPNELQEEDDNSAKLSFPILSDPTLLFGVLTGKQADLFTFELPTFTFETTFSRFFPIPAFPIVGAEIAGTIGADIDLAFGYDTSGLQRYFDSGSKKQVFDGFFLFDHENADGTGQDIPELVLRGALTAAGKATVAVGSASVGGGIFAGIDFNLNDPNDDGKIRGLELLDNALLGNAGLFVFDVSGHVDAGLFAEVEIGTGIFSLTKTYDIASVRLLDYDFPRPDGNTVPLAQLNGSTLELNIGPHAPRRFNPVIDLIDPDHDEDVDETFRILPGPSPDSVIVVALGREQQYNGITRITGNAGLGNDTVVVQEDLDIPVEIWGGVGNDILIGGAAGDILRGGEGDDDIRGGAGDDTLRGGGGQDTMIGEDGRDQMFGEAGDDSLDGGDDNDTLEGGLGRDILLGGSGNDLIRGNENDDVLEGATGSDRLEGGSGNDSLRGGRDGDMLFGDAGEDEIFGNEGSDEIHGGLGNDLVFGGIGNDLIQGGAGDDRLFGENSRDTIYGDAGNDLIVGGLASDDLFGGLGNDVIYSTDEFGTQELARHTIGGGGGDDLIYGEIDADTIHGDGINDITGAIDTTTDGADTIYAFAGDDLVQAGGGDDLVLGGLGADDIFGGLGNDQLYATDNLNTTDDSTTLGHTIFGGGGNDVIIAHTGNDTLHGDGANQQGGGPDSGNDGDDVIHALAGIDLIEGGNGNNTIFAGADDDNVTTGTGNDVIFGEAGNDVVYAGAGVDFVDLGEGDDFAVGGLGDDQLVGGLGNDVLMGGLAIGAPVDFARNNPANYELPHGYAAAETDPRTATGYVPATLVTPTIVAGLSIVGDVGDGKDNLDGGAGIDVLFGGFEADMLAGGDGADYIDAGAGDDLNILGGGGDDVIRGGAGNDTLDGGDGIDHLLGDDGDDTIFGGAGVLGIQAGQRLFGGAGRDELFAYAPEMTATSAVGDQLFGGAGGDFLYGNVREDVLVGDGGNDFVHGDLRAGPGYGLNPNAATDGANDLLLGGSGEDQLFGGGGNDTIWGGADSDTFEGQGGSDTQYGGSGIDLFYLWTGAGAEGDVDAIDGHFGNATEGDTADDNATDILVVAGTSADERILFSQNASGQARIDYTVDHTAPAAIARVLTIDVLDASGVPLIEQFQAAGLGGDDQIGFAMETVKAMMVGLDDFALPAGASELNLAPLVARSNDFVGVFDGNSGNDLLVGARGRDRLDGGRGSDVIYGFAGDDRLWGDGGEGAVGDHDVMFAGGGNDDLVGGQGKNSLYAWSFAPQASLQPMAGAGFDPGDVAGLIANGPADDFGVFVDPETGEFVDNGGVLEVTGLNRMVGGVRDDNLFGGTTLDFLFGNGGNDTLFRADGTTFTSLDGNVAGDAWKEYARESDQVWYVGGTNAADEIRVDFVTEPGLLADHHLITRLTENNGNFSFAAQVRLDFNAIDDEGNRIWDAEETLVDANARSATLARLEELGAIADDQQRAELIGEVEIAETDLVNGLLPPEGDFLAIVVDALDGNDLITVGPTVQKSVWIDAGAGDDRVEIRGGNAILVDKAESAAPAGGLAGRNDLPSQAFAVPLTTSGVRLDNLTFDNPNDVDWFAFTLPATGSLNVVSTSPIDKFTITIYPASRATDDSQMPLLTLEGEQGQPLSQDLSGLDIGAEYLLEVTNNLTPTIYGIEFDLGGTPDRVDMGLRSDSVRRDVIFGGDGNDILQGGAGEDFIFGGAGNDVITGGLDRNASDLMFAGPGADTFQIIPDDLPLLANQTDTQFDPVTDTFLPTFSDQMFGGDGNDRVLYLGGDFDRLGHEVPDFVAIRYNTALHRYEFASLVWDAENQRFATEEVANPQGDAFTVYRKRFQFFQADAVENTVISTRAGDDVVHGDPEFQLLPLALNGQPLPALFDTSLFEEWGIDLGDFEQGAEIAALDIRGGDGDDLLLGGARADRIDGGSGSDIIAGGGGNDTLFGGSENDDIYGADLPTFFDLQPVQGAAEAIELEEFYEYELAAPFQELGRGGIDLADFDSLADGHSIAMNAFGFEGNASGDMLSGFETIGDFDGDGSDDYLVSGENATYILLRPLELYDLNNIAEYADIIVDHEALGTPAQRSGDINGDGLADLVFGGAAVDPKAFTVILGSRSGQQTGDPARDPWPRFWNQEFATNYLDDQNRLTFFVPDVGGDLINPVAQFLNYDNDGFDDVLIVFEPDPEFGLNEDNVFGEVFSGKHIVGFTAEQSLGVLVGSDHTSNPSRYANRLLLDATVVGDVNGDGRDDILLVDLGTASLVLGGSVNDGSGPTPGLPGIPVSGVGGAVPGVDINYLLPGAIDDINGDGLADFALYDENQLHIFHGATTLADPIGAPDLSIGIDPNSFIATTSGDFNGNGHADLAVTSFLRGQDGGRLLVLSDLSNSTPPLNLSDVDVVLPLDGRNDNLRDALRFQVDDAILLSDTAWLAGQADVTTSFWINRLQAFDRPEIVLTAEDDGTSQFRIEFDDGLINDSTRLRVITNGAGDFVEWEFAESINDLTWHHFVVVRDGTNNRLTLYVDGRSKGGRTPSTSLGTIEFAAPMSDATGVAVGREFSQESTTTSLVRSQLDDVAVWSRVLSSREISEVIAAGPDVSDSTLQLLWNFDEDPVDIGLDGSNQTIRGTLDSSGNDRTGDIGVLGAGPLPVVVGNVARRMQVTPGMDFDGNGVDDLVVFDAAAGEDAGRVYFLYGAGESFQPHDPMTGIPLSVTDLANVSVPGSGSFLINRGTGGPEVFDNGGQPFFLAVGEEQWFRFSTLGDGRGGDSVRVNFDLDGENVVADLLDAQGRTRSAGSSAIDLRASEAGTYFLRVHSDSVTPVSFTIEIDAPIQGQTHETSSLPDHDLIVGEDGDDILVGNRDRDILVGNSGADLFEGEIVIVNDGAGDVERPVEIHDFDPATGDIRSDVVNIEHSLIDPLFGPLDPLIEVDDEGLRTAIGGSFAGPPTGPVPPPPAPTTTVGMFTGGDVGEGIDADGAFAYAIDVNGPDSIFDFFRGVDFSPDDRTGVTVTAEEANSNWKVSDYGSNSRPDVVLANAMKSIRFSTTDGVPLTVDLADLIVGQEYKLQLLFVENADSGRRFNVVIEGDTVKSALDVALEMGGGTRIDTGVVLTHQFVAQDDTLNIELNGLGITGNNDPILSAVTLEFIFGPPVVPEPRITARATELASRTVLDASAESISDLSGAEHLVNLRSLDLSDNALESADLAALEPHVENGEPVGLSRLEVLDLSGNAGITDISNLAGLTQLRILNLDGTGVDPTDQATLNTLASLTNLEQLFLPTDILVAGTNLAGVEGQTVTLSTDPADSGYWTVTDAGGVVVADQSRFPVFTGAAGQPAVVVAEADAPMNFQVSDLNAPATLQLTVNGVTGPVTLPLTSDPARLHAANPPAATIDAFLDVQLPGLSQFVSISLSDATIDQLVTAMNLELQSAGLDVHLTASNVDGRLMLSTVNTGLTASLAIEGSGLSDLGFDGGFFQADGTEGHVTDDNASLADLIDDLNVAISNSVHAGEVVAVAAGNRLSFETTATGPAATLQVADLGAGQNLGVVAQPPSTTIAFTPADNGILTVNHDGTALTTFSVFVSNVAPSISGLPTSIDLNEGDTRTTDQLLAGIVIDDVAADVITRQVTVTDPAGVATDLADVMDSFTFADQGSYKLTVTVTDDDGGVDTAEMKINVTNVGPTVELDATLESVAGQAVSIVPTVSDPGSSDTLSYDWDITTNNGQFVLPSTAEVLNFTPQLSGIYTVTLIVTDADGAQSGTMMNTMTITVKPDAVFDVPAGSGSGSAAGLGGASIEMAPAKGALLRFDATDPSLPPWIATERMYAWTATPPNGGDDVMGTSAVFEFIPVVGGEYTISLVITDVIDGVPFTSDMQTASVNVADSVPVIVAAAGQTSEHDTFTFTATNLNPLPPIGATGSLLQATRTYDWQATAGGAVVASSAQEVFRFIPKDDGLHTITLTVTDTIGSGNEFEVISTAVPLEASVANAAPVVDLGNDFTSVEGTAITLVPDVSDAFHDLLTFDWLISGPAGDLVSVAPELNFTPTDNGTYAVSLVVTDDDGASSVVDSVVITVVNAVPLVDAGSDQTINEGQQVSFNGSFTDAGTSDGPFTWEWDFGDGNTAAGTLAASGTLAPPVHTYADSGVYQVTLTVTDKDVGVGVGTATVTVNNLAPASLTLVGNLGVFVGQAWELTGRVEDLDGLMTVGQDTIDVEPLRGTANFGDGSEVPIILRRITDGLFSYETMHIFEQAGQHTAQVSVRDDDGGTVKGTISIHVREAPELPGDYDLDSVVDEGDYLAWKSNFGATSGAGLNADGNGDGVVDAADYTVWRDNLGATAPGSGSLPGDYNSDSVIDEGDHLAWKSNFGATSGAGLNGDGNGDGVVDAADYTVWRDNLGATALGGGSLPGDYDSDSVIDEGDYLAWKSNFGATSGAGLNADGNGNGVVDAADYTVWRDNLGATAPGSGSLPGDYNSDSVIDEGDHLAWKSNFGATSGAGLNGDGNGDGVVDAADYTVWRDNLGATALGGGSLPGDYDSDSVIDEGDYLAWKSNFGATSGAGLNADGNGNGVVDAADYTVWRDNLGAAASGSGSLSPANDETEVTGPALAEPVVEREIVAETSPAPQAIDGRLHSEIIISSVPATGAAPVAETATQLEGHREAHGLVFQEAGTPFRSPAASRFVFNNSPHSFDGTLQLQDELLLTLAASEPPSGSTEGEVASLSLNGEEQSAADAVFELVDDAGAPWRELWSRWR